MSQEKWIYEDCEFDKRISNIMWTISGNYSDQIERGEESFISQDVALYHAVTAGGRRKYIDWPLVNEYVLRRYRAGFKKEILLGLVALASDLVIEEKIIRERPGVYDIRKKAYQDMVKNDFHFLSGDLLEKTRYALILEKIGQSPKMDRQTSHLRDDLLALAKQPDTASFLAGIDRIYRKYFPLQEAKDDPNTDNGDDGMRGDSLAKEGAHNEEESEVESAVKEIAEALLGESWSETDLKESEEEEQLLRIQEEDLEKNQEDVAYYYGRSFLPLYEGRKLQNKVCQGEHCTCRIHMTDGVIRSDSDNDFQKKYIQRNQRRNREAFEEKARIYKHNINKLKESILRTLVEEEMADPISSDSGTLVANKLWRIGRSANNKVFLKTIDNNKRSYVVDILIDASGSQRRKQAEVAIQAYILAQALSLVGLSNRVMGFSSFLDYTVLKRFRDYEDPLLANDNVFEYFCAGNNRDGLAIRAATDGLAKRDEDNKILIVLSDGRPNDIQVGKWLSADKQAYSGQKAIMDTAKEVRAARRQGILVLGVFTGKEEDLMAEHLIYGKDFAYIRDINRFAEVVIKYLKKIIAN